MYKKTLAVLLVVLMLVMGGVKVKAEHCGSPRMISRITYCEGTNCMKWGVALPNYMEEVEYGKDCWTSSGKYYYAVDHFENRKIGCC